MTGEGRVADSIEWRSQIQYLFETESRIVQAKVHVTEGYSGTLLPVDTVEGARGSVTYYH